MTPADTPSPDGGDTLDCDDCGYEAAAIGGDWTTYDADRPRMGAPMIVFECPECGSVVDSRPVY